MCRLAAITSRDYVSPLVPIPALETMKEGHDGSGLGLTMKNLGGEFEDLKEHPILSGICSRKGMEVLEEVRQRVDWLSPSPAGWGAARELISDGGLWRRRDWKTWAAQSQRRARLPCRRPERAAASRRGPA